MPGQRFGNPDAHVVDAAVQRLLQRVQEPAFIAQLNLLQAERASLQAVQSVNDAELGRLWGVVEDLEVQLALARRGPDQPAQEQVRHPPAGAEAGPPALTPPGQQLATANTEASGVAANAACLQLAMLSQQLQAASEQLQQFSTCLVQSVHGQAPERHGGAVAFSLRVPDETWGEGGEQERELAAELQAHIVASIRRQLHEFLMPQLRAEIAACIPLALAQQQRPQLGQQPAQRARVLAAEEGQGEARMPPQQQQPQWQLPGRSTGTARLQEQEAALACAGSDEEQPQPLPPARPDTPPAPQLRSAAPQAPPAIQQPGPSTAASAGAPATAAGAVLDRPSSAIAASQPPAPAQPAPKANGGTAAVAALAAAATRARAIAPAGPHLTKAGPRDHPLPTGVLQPKGSSKGAAELEALGGAGAGGPKGSGQEKEARKPAEQGSRQPLARQPEASDRQLADLGEKAALKASSDQPAKQAGLEKTGRKRPAPDAVAMASPPGQAWKERRAKRAKRFGLPDRSLDAEPTAPPSAAGTAAAAAASPPGSLGGNGASGAMLPRGGSSRPRSTEGSRPGMAAQEAVERQAGQEASLGSMIFICNDSTIRECKTGLIFGLPRQQWKHVQKIQPGMPLFLFNVSDRKMHGIYRAASHGDWEINPSGWAKPGSRTAYPCQVQVKAYKECPPVSERRFKPILASNYQEGTEKFQLALSPGQADDLCNLFRSAARHRA